MGRMLHNAEIVVQYEIMNSYVPCMCIQADWYRPCNTNQRTIGQSPRIANKAPVGAESRSAVKHIRPIKLTAQSHQQAERRS